MAISYVNAASSTVAALATATTCNVPASVANGDLLLWEISGRGAAIGTPGAQTGWSIWQAALLPTATTTVVIVYYRIASSEPASYTSTTLTSASWTSNMLAFRGVDQTTPKDVANTTATAAALVAPAAITPVTAGAWVVVNVGVSQASAAAVPIWASTNATAIVGTATSTVSAANSGVTALYYTGWASGAFSMNLSNSGGALATDANVSSVLRPAAAAAASPRPLVVVRQAVNRTANF